MEIIKSIDDELNDINESKIVYFDLFKHPELVFGTTHKSDKVDFHKYPQEILDDIQKFGGKIRFFTEYHNTSAAGCRIRFKTTSRRVVFKIQLKRAYKYKNIMFWNSSGFDIFLVDEDGNYKKHEMFVPKRRKPLFAEEIRLPKNSSVCMFLPNFDTIEKMYIGIEVGSRIAKFPYQKNKQSPILFYGNSITQGASASKTGNSFPNIVSRQLDQDIINISLDKACKGTQKMAGMIGQLDCDSIVIDYSRDAISEKGFKRFYEPFYKKIRQKHPDKKIVLMTSANFNNSKLFERFDEIITETYENAIENEENTFLINQKELFDPKDIDLVSVDSCHYNDFGMFKVAEKICEILNS